MFFRLAHPRWRAIASVLACLAVSAALSYFLYPLLISRGGMGKFFAMPLLLGLYALVLSFAYRLRHA
jgi:hypothetical protein